MRYFGASAVAGVVAAILFLFAYSIALERFAFILSGGAYWLFFFPCLLLGLIDTWRRSKQRIDKRLAEQARADLEWDANGRLRQASKRKKERQRESESRKDKATIRELGRQLSTRQGEIDRLNSEARQLNNQILQLTNEVKGLKYEAAIRQVHAALRPSVQMNQQSPVRAQNSNKPNQAKRKTTNIRKHLDFLLEKQHGMCGICYKPLPYPPDGGKVHVDHIIPVSVGGTDDRENLQATHAECNLEKGDGSRQLVNPT